ncbi:DUF2489 domain-containing protein [Psychromonas sp.]|uniref:DUF2489 domain-containing protein n=1 Tax=Psychromonas sp. TaxID=1884585 RepID=UPI003568C0D6
MQLDILLAVLAVVIIIGLAFYAGMLIKKINVQKAYNRKTAAQQEAQQALKKQQRNDKICESIRLIARATAQKQCNVSEAAIRLTVLLETLLLKEPIDIVKNYPALSELFDKVKEMPTHEQRQKTPVKEIKILDMKRKIFESQLEDKIIEEMSKLTNFAV